MREHNKIWTKIINERMGTSSGGECSKVGCLFWLIVIILAFIFIPKLGEWLSGM